MVRLVTFCNCMLQNTNSWNLKSVVGKEDHLPKLHFCSCESKGAPLTPIPPGNK